DKSLLAQPGAANQLKCLRPPCLPVSATDRLAKLAKKPTLQQSDAVLYMKLVGSNPAATVRGMGKLPGASNYFIGNDPARWQREVPNYAKVSYEQIYPGIDLVYHGNPKQLEYDFVLAPGANPGAIRMDVQGADKLDLDVHGDLV